MNTIESFVKRIKVVVMFFKLMEVKITHVIIPVFLNLLEVSVEVGGLFLLVPLAKGVISNNYSFVNKYPILKNIVTLYPEFFQNSDFANVNMLILLVSVIFMLHLIKLFFHAAAVLYNSYYDPILELNIKKLIFNKALGFGQLFFDRNSQAYIRRTIHLSSSTLSLLSLLRNIIGSILQIAGRFVVLVSISWQLSLCTFIVFPILYFSSTAFIHKMQQISNKLIDLRYELNQYVFNILACFPLIKINCQEEQMKNKYFAMNNNIRKLRFKTSVISSFLNSIEEIMILTALISIIVFAAFFLKGKQGAEISRFIVFFYIARQTLPIVNIFNIARKKIAVIKPSLIRILELLDDNNKHFVSEGSLKLQGLKKDIEFKGLDFFYIPNNLVLKNVNFTIEKGKMTALVGPTGAGKTTLVKLLVRFYECPPGSIMLDGVDIRNFTLKSLMSHIAFVSQRIWLFNDTLRNNIIFGLDREVSDQELMDAVKKVRLYDFIMALPEKFETIIGDAGVRLSGGQRQCITIARALLKNAEIIILDEATSSLDTHTEQIIHEAIDEATIGRTAIVIAHRISTIKNADKVVVIENGCVLEEGPVAELLEKRGKFYEYWEAQNFNDQKIMI